jgi:hypothetical protein
MEQIATQLGASKSLSHDGKIKNRAKTPNNPWLLFAASSSGAQTVRSTGRLSPETGAWQTRRGSAS